MTRKDATLQQILRTLDSLNLKMDRILSSGGDPSLPPNMQKDITESTLEMVASAVSASTPREMDRLTFSSSYYGPLFPSSGSSPQGTPTSLKSFQVPAPQGKDTDNILAWPAVQAILERDGIKPSQWNPQSQGTENWLTSISTEFPKLAVDRPVDILYSDLGVLVLRGSPSIHLNKSYIESLCTAYFQSFHCVYPMLDPDQFYHDLLPKVCDQSFSEECEESALVLMVLAIGSVAQEGAAGSPVVDEAGRETGVRGGTLVRPPGHLFLTEAKRRMGLGFTYWNLNNLQCTILFASV